MSNVDKPYIERALRAFVLTRDCLFEEGNPENSKVLMVLVKDFFIIFALNEDEQLEFFNLLLAHIDECMARDITSTEFFYGPEAVGVK